MKKKERWSMLREILGELKWISQYAFRYKKKILGYIVLGIGFGILLRDAGYGLDGLSQYAQFVHTSLLFLLFHFNYRRFFSGVS